MSELKQIKSHHERQLKNMDKKLTMYQMHPADVSWLINHVEELELEINDWRAEVQKWQKFYKESEESHLETKGLLYSTISENKRYREVLEEIARGRFPGASYKARQALEELSDDYEVT